LVIKTNRWNYKTIIERDNIGSFHICIIQEIKDAKTNIATGKSMSIDFGLKTFLTLSDKREIEAPLYHLKNLTKQKRLNGNLSKKQKGSNGRKRVKLQSAKLHIKTANQRRDYFYKLSNQLVSNCDNIFIEDLNMKTMQMMWGRKISDLAFGEFINILEYKANVTKIDGFYSSSKICSNYGFVLK